MHWPNTALWLAVISRFDSDLLFTPSIPRRAFLALMTGHAVQQAKARVKAVPQPIPKDFLPALTPPPIVQHIDETVCLHEGYRAGSWVGHERHSLFPVALDGPHMPQTKLPFVASIG